MKRVHRGRAQAQRRVALSATAIVLAVAATPSSGQSPTSATAPTPTPRAPAPWRVDAIYKVDLLDVQRPAVVRALDLLDVALTVDAAALLGWDATTIRVEALATHGGKPNRTVGTLGGISNLEVAKNSVRPYATWIARDLTPRLNVLVGLYDLNSEFYSTDASALLIHPAFGIGSEMAQTGANGPSIFPNLSFGVRVRVRSEGDWYAEAAALDGVPGSPSSPGQTSVHLRASDGALLVGEGGWQRADAGGHAALGVWTYTRSTARLDGNGAETNRGAYMLAQGIVRPSPQGRTSAFLRVGIADPRVNALDAGFEAGVLTERPLGAGGPAAVTVGITGARLSPARHRLDEAAGAAPRSPETTLEAGARWRVGRYWAVQPLVQRVWNIAGHSGNAIIAGLRIEGTLRPTP